MATADAEPPAPRRPIVRVLARAWPWLTGLAILIAIAVRVPYAAFRGALGHGPHLALAAVDLIVVAVTICTDGVAAWVGLTAVRMPRPAGPVLAVRGATQLLVLVNYALGQGAFGYYLHRSGAPARRAVGATLFLVGTNLAALLVLAAAMTATLGAGASSPLAAWVFGGCAAFAAYLIVIGWAPGALARRETLAPLFDAGLRGHALALLARLPHVAATVVGPWLALRVWGIPVPLTAGLVMMPLVVIASVLPIAPGGLGTTQAAMVYAFAAYAAGAAAADRDAQVLAFAIVHYVYTVLAVLVVGLVCLPFARRAGAIRPSRT